MIRVLHSVSNMDRGGIETMLMNFYRHIDREQIQFDFLANKPDKGDYDEEIKEMGGNIFVTPGYMNYKAYLSYMTDLFKEHPEYKIIHTHNGSLMIYALQSAKKNNIPVRIAHAHATAVPVGLKNELKKIIRPLIKYVATDYWGCSNAAGEYYFSKRRWNNANELIHNAIAVDDFTFNESKRAEIRRQYGLSDKFVVGNVGRLAPQKNQKKLIEVFSTLHKIRPDSHLVIIGTGELEQKLKQQVAQLGLTDSVTFTGVLSNVNEWYSAFDVFAMTSIYEGLPVVAIEAQAADLPCVLTNTITPEVKITENMRFLGLNDDAQTWAKSILELQTNNRVARESELKNAGYDIQSEAKRMQNLYLDLYSKVNER